jgi:hypothetical protein
MDANSFIRCYYCEAPSVTRERACRLQLLPALASAVILDS